MQLIDDGDRQVPVSYYHGDGPVGEIFASLPDRPRSVGVIGLGVGGLTPYGNESDRFTYYEIDGVVEDLARDERFFTLLSEAEPDVDVVIGDGRVELERLRPTHDLLVVDAFASDSIPVHLLTLEAFESYVASLAPDGVLLVHISNRHLDLEPIVGRIGRELGLSARVRTYEPSEGVEWAAKSTWVLIEKQARLELTADWQPLRVGESLWTDDYSNILSVVKWN
jgi:spermidine synthase